MDGPAALTIAEVSGEVLHTTAEALATGQTAGVIVVSCDMLFMAYI